MAWLALGISPRSLGNRSWSHYILIAVLADNFSTALGVMSAAVCIDDAAWAFEQVVVSSVVGYVAAAIASGTVLVYDNLSAKVAILVAVLVLDVSLSARGVDVPVLIDDAAGSYYFVVVGVVVVYVAVSRVLVAVVVQNSDLHLKEVVSADMHTIRPRFTPTSASLTISRSATTSLLP